MRPDRPAVGRRRLSLRARLLLPFAVGMAAILSALGAFLYSRLGAQLLDAADQSLRSRAASALADPHPLAGRALGGAPLVDADEAFGQVLDRTGRVVAASPGLPPDPLLPAATVAVALRPGARATSVSRRLPGVDDPSRLLLVPDPRSGGAVLLGTTLGDRQDALRQLLGVFAVGGPLGLAAASLAGWALAGAALRPVERLRTTAETLSHDDPAARLPVPATHDELARLAVTLNDLMDRMHAALDREHRFVDDASHELRTPLGVLKAELDLATSRPRAADELACTVRAAARETDRLVRLAEDLLVLARARGGGLPLRREPTALRDLLVEALSGQAARAACTGRSLTVDAPEAGVLVDPTRLRQAVRNLVDNALEHGAGPVRVRAEVGGGRLLLSVHDDGPGFPESVRDRAFEPFVRGGGKGTGTGLGLAVVAAVAQAHRGRAALLPTARGSAVGIELPL